MKKAEFFSYFVFSPLLIFFSRSQRIFLFFPDSFPRHIIILFSSMQRQFMQSTSKYSQLPKLPFYESFRFYETKNFRWKNTKPLLLPLCIKFSLEIFRNTKRAPSRNISETKNFRQLFVRPHSMAHRNFCTRQTGSTRNFRKHQRLPETRN